MAGIKLNKGLQPFDLYFEDIDKHETIYFNPSDSDLPKRLMECNKKIKEKLKALNPIPKNKNGEIDIDINDDEQIDGVVNYLDETDKIVYDAIDYAFGTKVSDVIFKHCGAFSVVNGEYFVFTFLNAIAPELQKIIQKNDKTAQTKANKYLSKYRK